MGRARDHRCRVDGTLAGCQKEGPAERAGKEIDGAVKKLTKQIGIAEPALRDAVFDAVR